MATIIYNGYTLPNQTGKFTIKQTFDTFSVSCQFIVLEASASDLITKCNAIEAACKEKNKNLSVSLSGNAEYNFSHAGNTGFLSRPNLQKLNNQYSTETSRMYSFSCDVQLPFQQAGYSNRQEASFTVRYEGTRRRTVTFSVKYTADPGNSALDNYTAAAKTWAGTILTALGGTYELVSEQFQEEHEEKILNGSLVYREILANETEALVNDGDITNASCDYSVQYGQEIGLGIIDSVNDPEYPVTVNMRYTADVNRDNIAADTGIETVYRTKVRPWILKHASDVLGLSFYSQAGTQYIIQNETYNINPYTYRVTGSITFLAPKNLDQVLEYSESITYIWDENITTQKLWDGKDHTYNTYSIGKTLRAERAVTMTKLGSPISYISPLVAGTGAKYLKLRSSNKYETKELGGGSSGPGVNKKTLYILSFFETYLYVEPVVYTNQLVILL